jgi:RNA polymerase sigma factor (sigma-70 family)
MDDKALLREYVENRSEKAFAGLVNLHADLVYSAALRQTNGDAHLAEEITQLVFLALARKARKLSANVVLAGWLINATRLEAANARRRRTRRRQRESLAAEMNSGSDPNPVDSTWSRIAPILDDSLAQLRQTERDAVVLHYLQARTYREVGHALGLSEEAARKRVSRALEELRDSLLRRGVVFPAVTIGVAISNFAVQAAPAGLASGITKAALAATGAGAAGFGNALLETLLMTKAKTLIVATVGVAAVTTPLVLQHQSLGKLRTENTSLREQVATVDELRAENERLSAQSMQAGSAESLADEQFSELLRLRGEVGRLRQQSNELASLRSETEQLRTSLNAERSRATPVQPQIERPNSNDVASANSVIFDRTATVDTKLAALRILRSANARPDDVVREMVQAYYATENPYSRADIFRQLEGVTTAELKKPLLEAVGNPNEFPDVREEAAETLGGFLPDPEVKSWLETLAEAEPDPEVRQQAQQSLLNYQRLRQGGQ